ncbi:hypothetical protein EXN66_Car014123 [Channa argus]|uniref:Uncharacterized protein n=1 Tax=Channa argus TaxID=215402 RepID=A0A6G1Q7E8_CHAAH|nr:hypothetical protein EXN66_Car014123 [Channa argus]
MTCCVLDSKREARKPQVSLDTLNLLDWLAASFLCRVCTSLFVLLCRLNSLIRSAQHVFLPYTLWFETQMYKSNRHDLTV